MIRHVPLAPGSIVAVDRGYIDFRLFSAWTSKGIFFVTRLKDNTQYKVVGSYPAPVNRNIYDSR
jgi:hypothetical protein